YVMGFTVLSTTATLAQERQTHQVELNGQTFTLPAGFTIELAAGPPLMNRPISADFDEEGRLYVTEAPANVSREDVAKQKKLFRVLRLTDSKGDGRFDKSEVFADELPFTEGAMWLNGSLYVAAPPSIWKLTDTKGSGIADKREEWFKGKTLTGCANDLHGPYRGPDGWIYWCKGAFAAQFYTINGKPFTTRASHIFRCRPDGSGLEPVMTGGMDNPVGLTFTPGGEMIVSGTFFQHPGGGKRDGLIHVIYGGIYGKDHDVIYDPVHKWTGPDLMPIMTHLGPAAPCGLHRYESKSFGPDYEDNLFCCCFNMRKVTRHVLVPSGATFTTKDEDWLVSSSLDFHPTDVLEDADGSLLILDTGGWYKLCCPTSALVKPDVAGAIYRVRKVDAPKVEDARGLKIDWAKTLDLSLLEDPRPAVQRRTIETLAATEFKDIAGRADSIQGRRNIIWAWTRVDKPWARSNAWWELTNKDESVRLAAIHSAGLWRDKKALSTLQQRLWDTSLHTRRAAAEAIGRMGEKRDSLGLLMAAGAKNDRVLEHSIIYALIEIGNAKETGSMVESPIAGTRRAAMIAMDQMDGGKLDPEAISDELDSTDAATRRTAKWIIDRHTDWGGQLTGFFSARLRSTNLPPAERDDLARQLAKQAKSEAVQKLLAEAVGDTKAIVKARQTALRSMAQTSLKQVPGAWQSALITVLAESNVDLLLDAIATARALPWGKQRPAKLAAALMAIGNDSKQPASARLNALAAIPGGVAEASDNLVSFLIDHLGSDQPVAERSLAAEILAHAKLSKSQLTKLTDSFRSVGPMEINLLLEAFAQSNDDEVGVTLIGALSNAPAQAAIRSDILKKIVAKYGVLTKENAQALFKKLNADAEKQKAKLETLLGSLKDGDIRRGQVVFNSQKASCISCHAIGYVGGKVGPDLTRVGSIRSERDLLESIMFPSASIAQGYEPVMVTLKNGKQFNGLLRGNAPEAIHLVLNATEEKHIAHDEIEEMVPSKVSVMPAGLDQQLSKQDLADLVAFLKACK
ncbi:MAG TPA: PVC-type heme-binding CxxCH protein, partial [Gemmataceae bacterium]|nr:PVC-type heme-binding CxxCH protein [Gemmataceae bacterium]